MAKQKFKKIGAGVMRLPCGRIIKQNESFEIEESEIPISFLNLLEKENLTPIVETEESVELLSEKKEEKNPLTKKKEQKKKGEFNSEEIE